jgi:hypothetical protein
MTFGTDSYLLATCPVTDDGRGTFDQYPVGANCSERQSPKMEELGEQPAKMPSNHLLGSHSSLPLPWGSAGQCCYGLRHFLLSWKS